MEQNIFLKIKSMLYESAKEDILTIISRIEEPEILYVYIYNYNWDNGFEIPQLILDNDKCDLSIALLIFYSADGSSYLLDKSNDRNLPQWYMFVKKLYDSILRGKYKCGKIQFKVPLSKVQIFKLKKILTEQEDIFFMDIEGENLDIIL